VSIFGKSSFCSSSNFFLSLILSFLSMSWNFLFYFLLSPYPPFLI
jgi:hypothetical protein